jgi:D-sedoheptulose 7-phosphate isomerase
MKAEKPFESAARTYLTSLQECFTDKNIRAIEDLAYTLRQAWSLNRNVYICGNGGSAANAIHMANDFHYGIGACRVGETIPGLRVEALSANTGVLTCLANDTGYENIYSQQLLVKGQLGDILIALSGSGNSPNIVKALETAKAKGMKTYVICAFDGGQCKGIADVPIHFDICDMQVAEDTQLIVGHICMQWLSSSNTSLVSDA